LTRAITIIALTCFLVVGAAAASILGRDSVPAWSGISASLSPALNSPVSNRESKKDKLAVGRFALASFEPQQARIPAQIQDQAAPTNPGDQLRMAFASTAPADIEAPKPAPGAMPSAPPKPKLVVKPP
jgi:hypothetical protein